MVEEEERSWGPEEDENVGRGGWWWLDRGGALEEEGGGWVEGLVPAAWVDQADLPLAEGWGGRILETRAGKSSSWKEEVFLGWAE